MPSKYQAGTSDREYPNEAYRMLATKNDATIRALVKGIRRRERARQYIESEIALAEEEDRSPRKKLIGMLNAKVSELAEAEDEEG